MPTFEDQLNAQKAKNILYSPDYFKGQSVPFSNNDPNVEQIPSGGDSVNVQAKAPQEIPYSPIQQNLPEQSQDEKYPLTARAREVAANAPAYEQPSGKRRVLGQVLKIGSALAGAASGSPGIAQLGQMGGEAIEQNPNRARMREYNTQLENAQRAAQAEMGGAKSAADIEKEKQQALAETARRTAESQRGGFYQAQAENLPTKLQNQIETAKIRAGATTAAAQSKLIQHATIVHEDGRIEPALVDANGNYTGASGEPIDFSDVHQVPTLVGKPINIPLDVQAAKEITSNNGQSGPITKAVGTIAKIKAEANPANTLIPVRARNLQAEATVNEQKAQAGTEALGKVPGHVAQMLQNPTHLETLEHSAPGVKDAVESKYREITGLSPNKLDQASKTNLERSNKAIRATNDLTNLVFPGGKIDPDIQQILGPFNGSVEEFFAKHGANPFQGTRLSQKAATLEGLLSQLQAAEVATATNGRGNKIIAEPILKSSAHIIQEPSRFLGALNSVRANANNNIKSIDDVVFGPGKSDKVEYKGHLIPKFKVDGNEVKEFDSSTKDYTINKGKLGE